MPSYGFGVFLEKTISVHFPGGRLGWVKAGCDAVLVPVPAGKDIAYVLTPKASTGALDLAAFRKAVERNCARRKVEVRWADATNFEGCDPAETKDRILAAVQALADQRLLSEPTMGSLMVLARPVALTVVIESTDGAKDAQSVVDAFRGIAGLCRLVVVYPLGIIMHEQEAPAAKAAPAAKIEAAHEGRAINADDVADVASMLEHCKDVTEFLGKI